MSTASVASSRKAVCLRRCTDGDVAYLTDLRNRLAPHFLSQIPATDEKTFSLLLVQSSTWVLEVDGKPAGAYALYRHSPADDTAEFGRFMVEPSLQNNGYGRMMLDHAIETARRWGVRQLHLVTKPANVAACDLYEKAGFEVTQVRMELDLD